MKKILFLLLALIPYGAFAGEHTDRICSDDSRYGIIHDSDFRVSYPGENVTIGGLTKVYKVENKNDTSINRKGYYALYYILNITGEKKKRSELYVYNCVTKAPKLLLTLTPRSEHHDYIISLMTNSSLVLTEGQPGMGTGGVESIVAFDFYSHKALFSPVNVLRILGNGDGEVESFVSGKTAWYFVYQNKGEGVSKNSMNEALYSIDKKTLRVTKL